MNENMFEENNIITVSTDINKLDIGLSTSS